MSERPVVAVVDVAKEFSDTPGPRSAAEGPYSGELFLDGKLRPAFKQAIAGRGLLLVRLDGTEGYATSFLEAAFGGLAREFGSELVLQHLKLVSEEEPLLCEEIHGYIAEASE